MLIGIGSLFAGLMDDFENRVHAETTVRVDHFTFTIHKLLRKFIRVDPTGEELGGVEVEVFGKGDCLLTSASTLLK